MSFIEETRDGAILKRLALTWDDAKDEPMAGHGHIEITDGEDSIYLDGSDPVRAQAMIDAAQAALDRMQVLIGDRNERERLRRAGGRQVGSGR